MSDDKQFVPVILDREITSPDADAFGHRHFAFLMQGLIESARNDPPYSIGLLGQWGSGKSSIKSLYLKSLADDASSSTDRKSRSQRIHPITFNAWRFGGEDIKRALLRQVFLELGGDKNKLDESLFKHVQHSQPQARTWSDVLQDALEHWGWSLVQTVVVFALLLGTVAAVGKIFNLTDDQVIGWLIGASVVVSGVIIKFLLEADRKPTRQATITKIDAPRSAAEQYEDFLMEQMHAFRRSHKHCERIVIFVDDLDRLSPEEMVSGLDAVRTFMEIPRRLMPSDLGIVFVISCDEDRIADALADKRRRLSSSDLPGAVFTHADAHRFLDRIFQFRLEIPPFPKRDMRNFAEAAILKALPELRKELEAVSVSLETLIDRMIHVGVSTPRNALQIVNAFVQSWWIAKRRERDGAGTEAPGGLQEGAITKHPLALGAICSLRVDFPDFYRDLQREPDLIRCFTDVFVRGLPFTEQPDSVRDILGRYAQGTDTGAKRTIRSEYRNLRQFIASLQGLRWPKAMRPLLLLSQDPVSRKFGDRALALYDSFVSGDSAGVIAQLGREHDANKLADADMRLLHEMVEELDRETDVRRNNAAFVLASLGDRYPAETAHLLLSPLARRLAESPELRWRLGVVNIRRALEPVPANDRQDVAVCLMGDLLKINGSIEFRLESGEPPSLEEAMEMARQTAALLLQVRNEGGLTQPQADTLLEWLLIRRVAAADKEQSLSFSEFEAWIAQHEGKLLPALGGRYSDAVLDHLENSNDSDLDVASVVRRCKQVFDDLWNSGEESREELWQQVARMVASESPSFVKMSSDFVLEHVDAPDGDSISKVIAQLSGRLEGSGDDASDALDRIERGRVLVAIVTQRKADLQSSCEAPLTRLVEWWSQQSDLAGLATKLVTSMSGQFEASSNKMVGDWINRLLSDLTEPCIDWLAEGFGSRLSDPQRRQIIKRLNPIHQSDNINEQQSGQYSRFMDRLSEESLSTNEMKGHLDSVVDQVRQRHANPNDYLKRVFAPLPRTLSHASPGQVGPMLNELFNQTKGNPALFAWLHCQMAGFWPTPSSDMPQYVPDRVLADAMEVANRKPSQEFMYGPLKSATQLVSAGFVSSDYGRQVLDCSCKLWRFHREQATRSISAIEQTPDPRMVATMLEGLQPTDETGFTDLTTAWALLARRMDADERHQVGVSLLAHPAVGTPDQPDRCLYMWVNARSDDRETLLALLVADTSLNDEQRRRVWQLIEGDNSLGFTFLSAVLPKIAGLSDSPNTVSALLDSEKELTARAKSQDERYALGQRLIEAFRASSSHEAKNRIIAWIKRLNVDAVIEEITRYGELSEDEAAIVESQFSKSKHWKKVKPQ